MQAKIYKPTKSAMQSGFANTQKWIFEYLPLVEERKIDDLMGWTSSRDMEQQVKIYFDTKEEAVRFAENKGTPYEIIEPKIRKLVKKSYSNNFK